MQRQAYDTDLTDAEWAVLEPEIPPPKPGGRPRKYAMREVVNGLLYLLRTGCAWRHLPHDFPKWQTVYHYFRRWPDDGTLQRIHDALRRRVRIRAGREPEPSAAVLDSQSVKTTERGALAATTRARR
jgi:putative transposase